MTECLSLPSYILATAYDVFNRHQHSSTQAKQIHVLLQMLYGTNATMMG